jgi:CubicO group peptidase (beta-lactamase class C family)
MTHVIELDLTDKKGKVAGFCDPKFQPVLDEFVLNFEHRQELGASVCLNIDGETVVDLWGGKVSRRPDAANWQKDTISVVFSSTKGAVALCAHQLVAEGKLDLNAPVVDYWPAFGAQNKKEITVAMMLNHSAGLPALRDKVKEDGFLDWHYMVERLAAEKPFWRPGTRNGYHMSTFGWTVGELIKRVSGHSLGSYFQRSVAEPLGLDFHIGLPESEHHRVARMARWAPKKGEAMSPYTKALLNDKGSIQYLALLNNGGFRTDASESYTAEYGAGGGVTNARGLAGLYCPLANGGGGFIDGDAIELMSAVSVASSEDATLLMPTRFSLGFMLSMDNRHRDAGHLESVVLGKGAFGHAGAGGSIGFADPECHLGFGYSMNRMGPGILLNERGQTLTNTVYKCLGYRTDAPGFWIR